MPALRFSPKQSSEVQISTVVKDTVRTFGHLKKKNSLSNDTV